MKKLGTILSLLFLALVGFQIFISSSKEEFAHTDLYDEIMQRGKIKVGIHTDSKPYGFINNN